MSRTPRDNPATRNYADPKFKKAIRARRLAEEIEEAVACLTNEAFEMTHGDFVYDPTVSDTGIFQLSESLRWLKLALTDGGIDY